MNNKNKMKMKTHTVQRNIRSAAFAALAFLSLAMLPGCTNEDNSTSGTGQGTLSFTLGGISEGETETLTRTQAVEPESVSQRLNDDLIMTCTLTPDAASKTKAASAMTTGNMYKLVVLDGSNKIVGSADGVAGTATPKIPVNAGTYTVLAYSYNDASSTLPEPGSVGTTIGSISVPAGTDLLYWSESVTVGASESKVVDISFARKASKVNVVVDASSLSATVTAAAATLGKSYATTLALAGGTVAANGTATTTNITWSSPNAESVTSSDATLFSNGETPLSLIFSSLTIGGTVYATSSSTKSTTFTRALLAGSSYTLTVNVHQAIPATITLAQDRLYFVASVYDNNYLPYTAPTAAATTAASSPDATTETLLSVQGSITTTGVTVLIPVTATASGTLPAYSAGLTVPASLTEDGTARSLTLSWAAQAYTTATTSITATIRAVGGTLNAKKLDINAGVGDDYLGVLLGSFSYPYNNAGATTTYSVRDIAGIPDKKFNQYDLGNTTTYEHQFLYLPVTGEDGNIWLSNNLGADYANLNSASFSLGAQATGATDYHAYGSLFQWGRQPDGHELITWTSGTAGTAKYSTVAGPLAEPLSTAKFITNGTSPYDWRSTQDGTLWATEASTNNPCPSGFRLPSSTEQTALFTAAGITNSATAFSSSLKFSVPGSRLYDNGTLRNAGSNGNYLSSSVNGINANYRYISSGGAVTINNYRGYGFTVRCLKN